MRYCQQLAEQVFASSPSLRSEDEILDAGFKVTLGTLPYRRATYLFKYDEDFPGDFIDEYKSLQGAVPCPT